MEDETIKVTIKNDGHAFTLETSPAESIAGVKVRVLGRRQARKRAGYGN